MRTLSRPMFNMGGPIKQGVMHGIREPYKDGSIVGGHQSPYLAGAHPLKDRRGRERHFIPAGWAAAAGLARFGPSIYRGLQAAGKFGRGYNLGRIGTGAGRNYPLAVIPKAPTRSIGQKIKGWFTRDPLYQAGKTGAGYLGAGLQKAGRGIKWAGTTPSGLLTTGLPAGWFGGKALYNKLTDEEKIEVQKELKKKKEDKDYGPYTKGKPTITAAQREEKAKADKEKRINELLDTMGYDKSRKDAAYNALIDAGRLVSERGTLDTKNIGRELIDPIVAATSARFDKPQQIREAVGLMKVKADIAEQMEDPQVKELRTKQLAIADKTIAGDTLEETIAAAYQRHGAFPSGANLAQLARTKGIAIQEVVDTGGDDVGDAVEYMEGRIAKNKEAGIDVPPGNYVVKDSILIIDSEGNVSRR